MGKVKTIKEYLRNKDEEKAIEELNTYRYLRVRMRANLPQRLAHAAVKHGCLRFLKKVHKTWPFAIEMPNLNEETTLHVAVKRDNAEMIRTLYELGTHAEQFEDDAGRTPIEVAVVLQKTNAIAALLELNPNIADDYVKHRCNAVGLAVRFNCVQSLRALHSHCPTSLNFAFFTLFHVAFQSKLNPSIEMIVALCELNPKKIDYPCDIRVTPLHMCVETQNARCRKIIAILHSYGSTSHFNISTHADAPKPGSYPSEYRFIRRLYFSRSLAECMLFSLDGENEPVRRI